MSADAVLWVREVTKTFGQVRAVDRLSFAVARGTITGLLGRNGAGKTTTLRMINGIFLPDAGVIELLGAADAAAVRDRIGYLPEERGLYRKMRVLDQLLFLAEIKGQRPAVARVRAEAWLKRFDLWDKRAGKLEELSKGNQQKVQLIGTLLHEPEIVVLDEPFSGLDPLNQQVFKDVIAELRAAGKTILFSTHIIEQAERACDHVCIIAAGDKVLDGRVADVKREHGSENLAIDLEEPTPAAVAIVRASSEVREVREDGAVLEAVLNPGADAQPVLAALVGAGIRLRRFERVEPSLEQIFVELVRDTTSRTAEKEVAHV